MVPYRSVGNVNGCGCLINGRAAAEGHLCQTEIEDLGVIVPGDEDVRWLDIAMNDPLGVGRVQSIGNPNGDVQESLDFKGTLVR